jgi:midasin (ATPase involved in ribosome maturation)
MSGSADTTALDMRGGLVLADGKTEMVYGPLPLAMMLGCPFMLDEATATDQSVLSMMFSALDRRRMLYVPETGEVIHAREGFHVVAVGNDKGAHVRETLKDAFRSRFQMLHVSDEHTMMVCGGKLAFAKIKSELKEGESPNPNKVKKLAKVFVDLIKDIRDLPGKGSQADARDLERAREFFECGKSLSDAVRLAFSGCSDQENARRSTLDLITARFGDGDEEKKGEKK